MSGLGLFTCTAWEAAKALDPVVNEIVGTVVIPLVQKRDQSRTGGWFTLWHADKIGVINLPVVGFPVGLVSPELFLKYSWFANEKAARLASRPADLSSFQSRDESDPDRMKHKYGGAIRVGGERRRAILSFSGFSEHEDEMVCVIAMRRLNLISDQEVEAYIHASINGTLAAYRQDRLHDRKPW